MALNGIDLLIEDGDFVSVMGPSGSGKSIWMNIIGLLDDFDEGEYIFNGINIREMPDSKQAFFRNRHIGFIFQAFNLLCNKTALDNVSLPLFYRGIGRKERNRLASGFLEKLGLLEWAQHRPDQLSGGQKHSLLPAKVVGIYTRGYENQGIVKFPIEAKLLLFGTRKWAGLTASATAIIAERHNITLG